MFFCSMGRVGGSNGHVCATSSRETLLPLHFPAACSTAPRPDSTACLPRSSLISSLLLSVFPDTCRPGTKTLAAGSQISSRCQGQPACLLPSSLCRDCHATFASSVFLVWVTHSHGAFLRQITDLPAASWIAESHARTQLQSDRKSPRLV